jgi:hypothetical protein
MFALQSHSLFGNGDEEETWKQGPHPSTLQNISK